MKFIGGATLIQVSEHYRIDLETVREFADYGLYPTAIVDGEIGIEAGGLDRLRKVISLHRALGINKEGIEAVLGLRERIAALEGEIESMSTELLTLRRRLGREETETLERLGLLVEADSRAWPS